MGEELKPLAYLHRRKSDVSDLVRETVRLPDDAVPIGWDRIPLCDLTAAHEMIRKLVEALDAIERNSRVGKHGQLVVERSKWVNYPARDYHTAVATLTEARAMVGEK